MATFLDISILSHFTNVFTFFLVFVIVFGLLETLKVFGDKNKGLNAIIALCMSFIVIFSTSVTAIIETFTPWFAVMIIVIFFILFMVRMFGWGDKEIKGSFDKNTSITTWILIFTGIIILFSLGAGFGQQSLDKSGSPTGNATTGTTINTAATAGSTNTGDYNQNMMNTLFHPKVLGMILMLLVVTLGMLFLTRGD